MDNSLIIAVAGILMTLLIRLYDSIEKHIFYSESAVRKRILLEEKYSQLVQSIAIYENYISNTIPPGATVTLNIDNGYSSFAFTNCPMTQYLTAYFNIGTQYGIDVQHLKIMKSILSLGYSSKILNDTVLKITCAIKESKKFKEIYPDLKL